MADDNTKRVPVQENNSVSKPVDAVSGPVDRDKEIESRRQSKIATGVQRYGAERNAGMLIDETSLGGSGIRTTGTHQAYRNSYASGLGRGNSVNDIPPYFQMMNEKNGGVLYFPVTLKEKYSWFRYWSTSDAYVGRAVELLTDLPMSKINLNMPKMEGKKKLKQEIYDFYNEMVDDLDLFGVLRGTLWEMNVIGQAVNHHDWDSERKRWSKITTLPPEEVDVFEYPFSDGKTRIEYRPPAIVKMIKSMKESYGGDNDGIKKEIVKNIPDEIKKSIQDNECILLNSDPYTKFGNPRSFAHHISRKCSPYMDVGPSIIERVLVPMLQKEHYKYTQLSLASRNMTPKNLIYAEDLTEPELDDLRSQVDLSYMDPDYAIVTNYQVTWEEIGADRRLLDLSSEYENIESQVFSGLGVTRELLTGEGSYGGNRITVEMLNTMFHLIRDRLKRYVERFLFRPVADAHEWYEEDKNGVRKYYYPKLGFNRITIRDNQEVFDSLFQLYQKGSLPIDFIYELLNIEPESIHEKIFEDLWTVKDANFNRFTEDVYSEVGRWMAENTDIGEKFAKYLNVKVNEDSEEGDDGFAGGGKYGSDFSEMSEPADEFEAKV